VITFVKEKDYTGPLFSQVEESQFFICSAGNLCQKTSAESYHVIADNIGVPCSEGHALISDVAIRQMLQRVERVKFN